MTEITIAIPKAQSAIHRDRETGIVDRLLTEHSDGMWRSKRKDFEKVAVWHGDLTADNTLEVIERFPSVVRKRLEDRLAEFGHEDVKRWSNIATSVAYDEAVDLVWFRVRFTFNAPAV